MQRKTNPFDRKGEVLIHPPPSSHLPSFQTPATSSFTRQPISSSDAKISPAVLLVIVILAIAFFVCGFLHLLVRFLMKRPSIYSLSLSRRYSENSASYALQRQLQQLFRLHDSGLDQHIIDALPVFWYKEIVGLKEPFDCAVCLCEFADQDQLRLLPVCSHAFHVNSVRLGKYRSSNLTNNEETSSSNLDARRCYSMGSCEYVIGDSDLLVSLTDSSEDNGGLDMKLLKTRTQIGNSMAEGDVEAKRISNTSKGESFSVSKIWQWSKKGRFPNSSHTNVGNSGPFHLGLPLTNKVQDVEDSV